MELCTPTLIHLNPSFSSTSNSLLLLRGNTRPSKPNSLKLSSFTPRIQVQPFLYHYSSASPFTVSAKTSSSSSVALGTENDRLPAELDVTETEESNSTVCSYYPFLSESVLVCCNKIMLNIFLAQNSYH